MRIDDNAPGCSSASRAPAPSAPPSGSDSPSLLIKDAHVVNVLAIRVRPCCCDCQAKRGNPLRAAHGLPASQQQPALAAPVFAHDGTGAKELLAADFIDRGARVLEHVEFVEYDLGIRQRRGDGVEI